MSPQLEIQLIAALTAAACALPGTFLVLRRMSMLADSITHTVLLGIVLGYFAILDLASPLLFAGAALMGVATVWLTEAIRRTGLVSEDSAIGLVFPFLFAVAVILITRRADSVHLDTDSVLLGELAFAPFDRMILSGVDIGAKGLYTSGALLLLGAAVIAVFFKELQIVSFDPTLAAILGFCPAAVHYGLMTLVSLSAVGAFQTAGSVLTVAFMIGPPATAVLLSDNLKTMLFFSAGIGAFSGVAGYRIAEALDVSIAGCIAVFTGVLFFAALLFRLLRDSGARRSEKTRRHYPG